MDATEAAARMVPISPAENFKVVRSTTEKPMSEQKDIQ